MPANPRLYQWLLGAALAAGLSVPAMTAVVVDDIEPPADPLARKAFDIFDRTCARCHQAGRLVGRDKPSKGFGNILKLDELAQNRALVMPGNPYASKVFKQIVDRDMPYDVFNDGADGPTPSADDVKALEQWINALAPAAGACEAHKFVTPKDVAALIAADLEKLPRRRAQTTRYLTLTHFSNICAGEAALNVYRQGAVKLVNSLSRAADVVRIETIDPDRSILRINLDDLGWDAADWDLILANYPYAVVPDMAPTGLLEAATGVGLPYVRADWLAFAAAQPPLYNKLLRLPATFAALAAAEGVDVERDIARGLVKRAAFQKSGVSANNRLIERHPHRSGYFWTSYDFAGNHDRQDLFAHPLGPGGSGGFRHDGGETIYSLPNGFQAYYLNTAKGDMIAKGPTSIVRDPSSRDQTVTNGVSCMGCHDQGMRKAKDDIRAAVVGSRLFDANVKEMVAALYPPRDVMDAVIEEDQKRFAAAMAKAGLDPTLKLNGVEMINALSKRYEDDVDAALAAAELGLTPKELAEVTPDADKTLKLLLRRLDQGLAPRDQFESSFKALAADLADARPLVLTASASASFGLKAAHGGALALTSDRDFYRQGDTPVFTVVASADCFLTLSNVDGKGRGAVLFPNKFQQNNKIRADRPFEFPGPDASFQFRMQDRGVETVIAVCTPDQRIADGISHDFDKAAFTVVENYTRSATRLITVEAGGDGESRPRPAKARFEPAGQIQRAAIKVEVR